MASKVHDVYADLRRRIELGELRPGELVAEADVVQRYAASRTPVREAVRLLASDGLVTLEPRRGARVAPVSVAGVHELFAYRLLLEVAASRLVAERARTDATIARLFAGLAERFEQVSDEDALWVVAADFDAAVAEHTPNRYLRRALADLRPHTVRLRSLAHDAPARMRESRPEHVAMARAIAAGDAEAAGATADGHLRGAERAVFAAVNPVVDLF